MCAAGILSLSFRRFPFLIGSAKGPLPQSGGAQGRQPGLTGDAWHLVGNLSDPETYRAFGESPGLLWFCTGRHLLQFVPLTCSVFFRAARLGP